MTTIDLTPELAEMIRTITTRPTYNGKPMSKSIASQIEIETRSNGAGVLAPYWLFVLQTGRPPRRSKIDSGLWKRIYVWMDRNGMFRSRTERGRINEAKSMTWYINKYGTEHFRSREFIDVYESARQKCIRDVESKYTEFAFTITQTIL
jgi:hypothetical protein